MKSVNQVVLIIFLVVIPFGVQSRTETWKKLENSHFIMYTDAREKTARDLFLELESFRILVLSFISFKIPQDAEKVKIILFRNVSEFRKYAWRNDILGFVLPSSRSAIIVQPARARGLDPTHIIYHEFVHTLLRFYTKKIPSWYQEGLAELFGATRYINGKFNVGGAPKDRFTRAAYGLRFASFDDIVSDKFQTHRPGYDEDPYLQYWMLVQYLEFGNKKRRKDLDFYLLLYADGMDSLKAFKTAFKMSPEALWYRELKPYFSHGSIPGLRISVRPDIADTSISYDDVDMEEVKDCLRVIGIVSSTNATELKEYGKGYKLLKYLMDNTDPQNKSFMKIVNNLVWLLSTCPSSWYRDGKEAVRLGELYIKGKSDKISYLDSLAAAYAEEGRFDEAIELQTSLLARLKKNDALYAALSRHLKNYKINKPWREEEK